MTEPDQGILRRYLTESNKGFVFALLFGVLSTVLIFVATPYPYGSNKVIRPIFPFFVLTSIIGLMIYLPFNPKSKL
jgi:hypothetical protein